MFAQVFRGKDVMGTAAGKEAAYAAYVRRCT